jgi:hypothetical protein
MLAAAQCEVANRYTLDSDLPACFPESLGPVMHGSEEPGLADIFVSYRRADSIDVVGRICDYLHVRFGEERVFHDVDSILFGQDFRDVIAEAISKSKVMLAVVGDQWADAADPNGVRRLDQPDDYVRVEVSTALQRGIPLIPVLVENASMPPANQLPEALRELVYRNGAPVRPDPDFPNDMSRLCNQLILHVGAAEFDHRAPLTPRPQLCLRVVGTPYAYQAPADADQVFVGRQRRHSASIGSDFVIRSQESDEKSLRISRRHFQILNRPDGLFVVDCSRSGTTLNGEKLEAGVPVRIHGSDRIVVAGVLTLEVLLSGVRLPEERNKVGPVSSPVDSPHHLLFAASIGDMVTVDPND